MTGSVSTQPPSARRDFRAVCQELARSSKAVSPRITLRLTQEEDAQLKQMAGSLSVSAYVRDRLFGESAAPRKHQQRVPVKDQEALSQVLGLLGQSHMASNLNQLARHANCGTLAMDEETESEIRMACARIAWIRVKLIEALGLKAGDDQ